MTHNDMGTHLESYEKPLIKSSRSKMFQKCSKTIPKGPPIKRCDDEC